MSNIKLNSEQLELKTVLINWIDKNNFGYFGILGAGGTGKTFVVCNILSQSTQKIVFLGATNKVVTVLKESLIYNGMQNPTCKTIDSFLGFRIVKDHENNSTITYRLPSKKSLPDIIVIDEVSMITFQKMEQIEKLSVNCKIILLGDSMQLPPIEENKYNLIRSTEGFLISKVFTNLFKDNSFTLTIQNRQKDGTLLSELIANFRKFMNQKMDPKLLANKKNNGVDILYFKTNDKNLKEFVKENDAVAVCYKNLTVLSLNWLIGSTKSMRKDYRLNEINLGDRLMFDQFYTDKETSFYTSNIITVKNIVTHCEEQFKIKATITKTIIFNEILVEDEYGTKSKIRYIHGGLYGQNGGGVSSSVYGQRTTYLKHIKEGKNIIENKEFLKDLNTRFSDYQNSFAKLKRPYAITCHKAQGSTYKNVIIPVYDFYALNYKDANQLLYVAMSRAKEKIIFIDKNEQFDNTSKRHSFSEFEKQAIASAFDYKCANCKNTLVEREFDCDHKTPLANGGKNSIENMQTLCKNCHKKKTANEKYL